MKKIVAILIIQLLLFGSVFSSGNKEVRDKENQLIWLINLEDAFDIAQSNGKVILINFTGSDWCGWCKKLKKEVFFQNEFIEYAKNNLILLELDFPNNTPQPYETKLYNYNLMQSFGIKGFPTILLLDKNNNVIARTGYQPGGAVNYVNHLKKYISNYDFEQM